MLQVQKYWFPENEMKKRYPQIQGFFAISSFTGDVSILQFILQWTKSFCITIQCLDSVGLATALASYRWNLLHKLQAHFWESDLL